MCKVMQQYENIARAEGIAEGMEKGIAEGMEKGIAEGMEKGIAEGMEKGMETGRLNTILAVREKMSRSGLSPAIIDAILSELPEKQA